MLVGGKVAGANDDVLSVVRDYGGYYPKHSCDARFDLRPVLGRGDDNEKAL